MKWIYLSLLLQLCICSWSICYPIDPQPLRKLVRGSEYIIIGYVKDIETTRAVRHYTGPLTAARIEVLEVLQGTIDEKVITVPFSKNADEPAPGHYVADTYVIAFLDKKKGYFRTHALNYGSKTLPPWKIDVYRSRILEVQKILALADRETKFSETLEWLIRCAESPATRWEGAYELSPESSLFTTRARTVQPPFQQLFSAEQKQRLKDALIKSAETEYTNFNLVDLVYPENELEVSNYLLQELKDLPESQLWTADEYMKRLLRLHTTPALEKLQQEFSETKAKAEPIALWRLHQRFIVGMETVALTRQ